MDPMSGSFDQVRLFKITRSSQEIGSIALELELQVASPWKLPPFIWLSHVWGDEQPSCVLHVNGHPLSITRNLFEALKSLIKSRCSHSIYCDEISVNPILTPGASNERAYQIGLMPSILERASLTLVWLGSADEHTERVFHAIESIDAVYLSTSTQEKSKLQKTRWSLFNLSQDNEPDFVTIDRPLVPELSAVMTSLDLQSLHAFFENPWFKRFWKLPEIVRSKNIIFRCGHWEASFNAICQTVESIGFRPPPGSVRTKIISHTLEARSLRRDFLAHRPGSLADSLEVSRNARYTRDEEQLKGHKLKGQKWLMRRNAFFFGPLSKDSECNINGPDPLLAAAHALNLEFYPQSLSYSGYTGSEEAPSWVPQWNPGLRIHRLNTTGSHFCASSDSSLSKWVAHHKGLRLDGLECDSVLQILEYLPTRYWYDIYNLDMTNNFFLSEWFDAVNKATPTADETIQNSVLEAFVSTIHANGGDGVPAEKELPKDKPTLLDLARKWMRRIRGETTDDTEDIMYFHAACAPAFGRRFGVTRRGNFCLLPRDVQIRDIICIPYGSKVPYVLRSTGLAYFNIGECYVHGMMHGQAFSWTKTYERGFLIV